MSNNGMDIFTRLGANNVAKILAALTNDMEHCAQQPSMDMQKWHACRYVDNLSHDAKIAVGDLIKLNGKASEIKECNSGLIINLDNLPDYIVSQVYLFIAYKNGSLS